MRSFRREVNSIIQTTVLGNRSQRRLVVCCRVDGEHPVCSRGKSAG
jgi:hypothetical protein